MKKLLKTATLAVLLATAVSCKKNNRAEETGIKTSEDSTTAPIDTVGPNSDTTNVSGAGTTGATGEASTGSGSAGTVQKGNTDISNDSTQTAAKSKK